MRIENQGKALFMGDSFYFKKAPKIQDKAAMKKGIYWKQAMHGVTSVNQAEKRMDASIADIKENVRLLQKEREEADAALNDMERKMQQAKVDYDVADGSQEEKDLELLKKQFDIAHHRISGTLTKEEQKRLEEMERTDYHNLSMEFYEQADYWKEKLGDISKQMDASSYVIRRVRSMRLESDAMEEAKRAKEELLEAASKETVGILKDEAVDALDEKAEEIKDPFLKQSVLMIVDASDPDKVREMLEKQIKPRKTNKSRRQKKRRRRPKQKQMQYVIMHLSWQKGYLWMARQCASWTWRLKRSWKKRSFWKKN